jgi:hypothetical protein
MSTKGREQLRSLNTQNNIPHQLTYMTDGSYTWEQTTKEFQIPWKVHDCNQKMHETNRTDIWGQQKRQAGV